MTGDNSRMMIDLNVKNSWPSWLGTRVLFLQKDEKGYSVSSIITRVLRWLFISSGHVTILNMVLVVRFTCIACFSPIAQSILNQISWNFARTLFAEYSEIISIKKYSIVQKLDHLACRPNAIFKPQSNQFNGFIVGRRNYKFPTCQMI